MTMAQTPAIMKFDGEKLNLAAGTARVAGAIVLVGTVPVLIEQAVDATQIPVGLLDPIADVPKTSDTFTAGDAVYWDEDGSPVTGDALSGAADSSSATGNLMGFAVADAATGDEYVRVKFTAAKRTATIAGSVTADDITGSDSSLGINGVAAAQGGAIVATGGTSSTGGNAGGAVSLVGGTPGATGVGGAVNITGAIGGATSGTGGAVAIAGGAGTNANASGGAVTIKGGEPHGTGPQGTVTAQGLIQTAGTTAAAITGAVTLTLADSGGAFTIDQDAAFDIDLPSPTVGAGLRFEFVVTDAGANNVTITVDGGAATFVGTIVNDVTSVIPCTGATITFATGVTAVGDHVIITSLTTGLYFVRAITSAAGGITIA
jgi:hypothetical protein